MSESKTKRTPAVNPTNTPSGQWPRCAPLNGWCLVYEMSQALGTQGFLEFVEFLTNAETGAMMTLKQNVNGLSAQVTGPVHLSSSKTPTIADALQMTSVAAENMLARRSHNEARDALQKSGGLSRRRLNT